MAPVMQSMERSICFFFFFLLFFINRLVSCQVFVGVNNSQIASNITVPPPAGLNSSCSATFNTSVPCDVNLLLTAYNGYFATNFSSVCAPVCLSSLTSLRSKQVSACASQIASVNGQAYPPTVNVDYQAWAFNYTCRKDKNTGAWCAPIFAQWGSGNATNLTCSDCVLGSLQLQLASPFGYNSALAKNFSSITSSCHSTGYAFTSPPPYTLSTSATTTSSGPAPTHSCASNYTIKAGDTCNSVSKAQNVSTALMLYTNSLQAHCTNFPAAGTQLCMPHTCNIYTVAVNDTCYGISQNQAAGTVTMSQIVSWNIDIDANCDNLEQLVGNQICISFPGISAAASNTAPASTATVAPQPTNVVNGTNSRCGSYYQVQAGDTCASVTQDQGISLWDFYFLNPEVNSTSCGNLFLGYSYCVQAVGDITTYAGYPGSLNNPCIGSTSGAASCYATSWTTATMNLTFPATANTTTTTTSFNYTSYVITPLPSNPDDFNLTITPEPTPTPYQTGMVSTCTLFYSVNSGDTCYQIAQNYNISLSSLYAWNPALGSNCGGLEANTWICVGTSGSGATTAPPTTSPPTTTTTSKPTSTNGGTAPPGPTQSGIPADCNRWVMQQNNVYCAQMAQNANITLSLLYALNPGLGNNCQGLWVGYAYCLGTASGDT